MLYKVTKEKGSDHFYVRGLPSGHKEEKDQILVHHIPYPETEWPEVEAPNGHDAMHAALYDLYQWHEGLKEGDEFDTPFGSFVCRSFHVLRKP